MARRSDLPVAPRLVPDLPRADPLALHDDLEVYRQTLEGDFSHQNGERITIEESRVTGARFTGATLDRLRLSDVVVERTDFSGAALDEATFSRVEFRDCRMSGLLMPQAVRRDVVFTECKLDGANFRMVQAERVRFDGVDLRGPSSHR
jgi:uncharacterized protein YjbI with pentapeptide repeats